jgi:hypothetical protein
MGALRVEMLGQHVALALWLERLGRQLDLTDVQLQHARETYEAIGHWLATSTDPLLAGCRVFVQGSIGLGTAIRPLLDDEFDVDLICHLISAHAGVPAATIKGLVGARLRENGKYAPLLVEKNRCWRLQYKRAFHLDATPAVTHDGDGLPALLIPDQELRRLTPTNPVEYLDKFQARAALIPRFILAKSAAGIRADVAEFPLHAGPKGILRRVVQVLKRHRDLMFQDAKTCDLRPISVIITTLASQAYERVVLAGLYESEFDLFVQVIEQMPAFIKTRLVDGKVLYDIPNETVRGENFADRWNNDARLPAAFYAWHKAALQAVRTLPDLRGLDVLAEHMTKSFGAGVGPRILNDVTSEVSAQRAAGRLGVAPVVGVTAGAAAATPVRANTFFGRRE